MFSMQSVSKIPLIATFQLSPAASLNLGRSQNGVLGYGLTCLCHFSWTEPGANTLMVDPMGELYIIASVRGGRGMIVNLPSASWGQTQPVYVESGAFFAMYSSHSDPEGESFNFAFFGLESRILHGYVHVVIKSSEKHPMSFSKRFCKFKSNTASDCIKHMAGSVFTNHY